MAKFYVNYLRYINKMQLVHIITFLPKKEKKKNIAVNQSTNFNLTMYLNQNDRR